MTVEVELPDGRTVEFPDGVTRDVIQRTTKSLMTPQTGLEGHPEESFQAGYAQSFPQPAPRPAAPPAPLPAGPARGGLGDPGTFSGAVVEGWQNAPKIVPQQAIDEANQGDLLTRHINSPALQIANMPLQALNALFRGGMRSAASIAEPIGSAINIPRFTVPGTDIQIGPIGGPGLGRDVEAMPEAFPTGDYGGGTLNRMMPPERPPTAPPAPQFVQEFYGEPIPGQMGPPVAPKPPTPPAPETFVPPGTPQGPTLSRINELIQADIEQAQRRPAEIPPTTTKDPVTGEVKPIQQPPNPADRSAQPQPAPQPEAQPSPTVPGAHAEPVGTDNQWLAGLGQRVQQVLAENGRTSLGAAATPEELAQMTPAQVKANRRMAELGEILSPPGLGEDTRIHVEGSEPTLAERAGVPETSQLETVLRYRNPGQFDPRLSANSQARIRKFDEMSGSDPQLATLNEDQARAAQADTAKIKENLQPADGQPLLKYYDDILNDPRIRERDDVMAVLKPLRDKLFDENGNLKTDAMSYWGMHDNIMAALAKAKDPLKASGAEKFAFDQLLGAKHATDAVMNQASGGAFQTFLDNQAKFFQQKNAMEVLQKFRTGMVDSKTGHIYGDKFHRWLADLAVRRGKPGVDAAMDIPDDVFRGLMDIDNDLKRASRIDLGKARGSPTNLFFEVSKAAGLAGAHALLGLKTGGVGNVVLQQATPMIAQWNLNRLTRRHLAAPEGGYRRNDLGP